MIQDLGENVFFNEFSKRRDPKDTDLVFVFKDSEILCSSDGQSSPIKLPEAGLFNNNDLLFLFMIDETAFYLYQNDNTDICIEGFSFYKKTSLRSDNPRLICFAGFTAYHLYMWYKTSRYCGQCGCEMKHSKTERAMCCPNCGNVVYPKIAPAVIVGVTYDDKIVVTRYKDRPYRGVALIAGFCEIGESPEQTARREVFEEVGLKIKDLKYFGSQPWGMDSNLLIGYMAKVDGSTNIVRDTRELSEALWLSREELKPEGPFISLTKTMIHHFKMNGY